MSEFILLNSLSRDFTRDIGTNQVLPLFSVSMAFVLGVASELTNDEVMKRESKRPQSDQIRSDQIRSY